jgi:hypothetical protein
MKMFGELRLVRTLTDEQIAAMRDPKLVGTVKLPTIEDAVKAGSFLAGRPEDIIEQLKAVEKRYPGLDRVICAIPLGDLDRFAKEVIPRLPRHQDRRRGGVDPRVHPPGAPFGGTSASPTGRVTGRMTASRRNRMSPSAQS